MEWCTVHFSKNLSLLLDVISLESESNTGTSDRCWYRPVLRIQDVLFRIPDRNFSIRDPGSERSRICIRNLSSFNQKIVSMLSEIRSGIFFPYPGSKINKSWIRIRNSGIVPKFILERKELLYPCRVEWTVGCRAWFLNNPPALSNHRKQLTFPPPWQCESN